MRNFCLALLAAAMVAFGAGQALADLTAPEKDFLMKTAASSMAQMELAQIAQTRGSSSQVRQLGTRLANDQLQVSQDLQEIADQADLTLPTEPDRLSQATAQRLRGTTGTGFDTAFVQQVVRDNQRQIAIVRRQAQTAKDPTVKAFAQRYLPLIQLHLQLAQNLTRPTYDNY
jgi:putative membrane protein